VIGRRSNRSLEGRRVVLVGATSGVGRATAELLAAEGCGLLLAARQLSELEVIASRCRAVGATTVEVEAIDSAVAADVDRLAEHATRALGGVDVWINTASVLVAGDLTACPVCDLERIVATNVLGTMLLSRAALDVFDRQRHGTLINLSSLLGLVPNPLVSSYCMTKFAIRGLTIALRQSRRPRAIKVCVVVPGPIDTPIFEGAANHTGHQLRAIPPAASPWRVAATVVRCARRPRKTTTTGLTGWGVLLAHRVAPGPTEWVVARVSATLLTRSAEADDTSGVLFRPSDHGAVAGGWRRVAVRSRLGDRVGRWSATHGVSNLAAARGRLRAAHPGSGVP
jgi:short-subunit dehydrogenase